MSILIEFNTLPEKEKLQLLRQLHVVVCFPSIPSNDCLADLVIFDHHDHHNLDDGNNVFLTKLSDNKYILSWRKGHSTLESENGLIAYLSGIYGHNQCSPYRQDAVKFSIYSNP